MHFGRPLAHFWHPLASKWLPLGSRSLGFGSLLAPFGYLLHPFGSLWLAFGTIFATLCREASQARFRKDFGTFPAYLCIDLLFVFRFLDFWKSVQRSVDPSLSLQCNSHNEIYDIGTEILYFQRFTTTDMFLFQFSIWTRQNDQCVELYHLAVSKHDFKGSALPADPKNTKNIKFYQII